ncbi:MAG: HD-GYP domain-containing protein [Lachnospiraceae bacterium]
MIDVKNLKGGEIISTPILSDNGSILIPEGTELKKEYIDLLLALNIQKIDIKENSNYLKENILISPEKRAYFVDRIQKVLEQHVYTQKNSLKEIQTIADEIINYVNSEISSGHIYEYPLRKSNLYEHSFMVCLVSLIIAKKMNLSEVEMKKIAEAALLHDIGIRYITVPFENKNVEQMNASDAFEFKKHTVLGYSALEHEEWITRDVKDILLMHHEKIDGSGFPMKRRDLSLNCKIIQICDVFNSMLSGTEAKSRPMEDAFQEFERMKGIKYDEICLDYLFQCISRYPIGAKVITNRMESGIVIEQTDNSERPIIMSTEKKSIEPHIIDTSKESGVWITGLVH